MGGEQAPETATTATTAVAEEQEREPSGITIEILQQHFHQPLMAVAEELGVSLTMIKRLCRKLGMPRWPFRQIDSINKAMEDLHDQLEGARTEADRARYCKLLDEAMKKKQLITRGAAAGVDPNVRNALYLADTANVSEEDIFGNPDLMPKLSAALKTITKRKRVKGKPLVDLIATVQRDGSLPACVQTSNGTATSTTPRATAAAANSKAAAQAQPAIGGGKPPGIRPGSDGSSSNGGGGGAARRQGRPPALVDAMATSNEEYAANIEHAYGSIHRPESATSVTSATTSVSPALSSLGTSGHSSSADDYSHLGWGHNNNNTNGSQQQQQQQQQLGGRHSQNGTPAAQSAQGLRGGRVNGEGYLQDSLLDSPTSSCATLVVGNSPGGGENRFSPGGSFSGGFSPALGTDSNGLSTTSGVLLQQPPSFSLRCTGSTSTATSGGGGGGAGNQWAGQPHQRSPAGGQQQQQQQQQQQHHQHQQHKPQKRLSTTSSAASTDVESLDTSHLLEFDDDDDDEVSPYGDPGYAVPAGEIGYPPSAAGAGAGAGGTGSRVSPEDLQELEDALLMDSFTGVMDEILDGEDIPGTFPKLEAGVEISFPGLLNSSAQPLSRGGGSNNLAGGAGAGIVPRGTPRSAGTAGSPRVQMFGGRGTSPSHAGSASPAGAASNSSGAAGAPRPGPRGIGRPRSSQVPPRPYTPGKSSRGGLWLAHGLRGENSPRVGSSPRPPTPGTPGTATGAAGASGTGARMAPSPKGRRRGDEAFPPEHFALPSPNDPLCGNGLLGGPSPKSRRVGARAFPSRFPGSPQAGLSPRVGFPPQSPLSGGGGGGGGNGNGFGVGCSPLGGSDRTYFPAPAAAALADASGRGHRRSNSNGLNGSWGSAPRHGGGGEGGLDTGSSNGGGGAASAAGSNTVASSGAMSTGFPASTATTTASGQNWSVRLGEGAKQSGGVLGGSMSASRQHGWGLASSGEMQHTSRLQSSSPSNAQQQQKQQQQQATGSRARSHGVVRRRHSAPIPPLQTFPSVPGAGAEWAGESIMGMGIARSSSSVKVESQTTNRQSLESNSGGGGGGDGSNNNALESFSVNFYGAATSGGGTTWGASSPASASTKMEATDGQWQQQQQAGAGGAKVEMSAVAVTTTATEVPSAGFEASFDGNLGAGDLMDPHDMTTTMSVDL